MLGGRVWVKLIQSISSLYTIKTFIISFASILGIEIIQFVTYLGSADIDDVLLNLIGSVMGYAVYMIYRALKYKLTKLIETNHATENVD